MRALGAAELLRLWEFEAGSRPAQRGLALLAAVAGGENGASLAHMTIGARDALLLELRSQTFGGALEAQTRCPACGEPLEFAIAVADLAAPRLEAGDDVQDWHVFETDGWQVRFRLPRVDDLTALGRLPPVPDLRRALLARCVDDVRHDGAAVDGAQLPDEVAAAVAQRMEALDPCADILLALKCGLCEQEWQAPFDILGYLWAEIGAHARRLLREVDALARAYGWREGDILALSSVRRRAYLELCGA